jgi:hypothetical protein
MGLFKLLSYPYIYFYLFLPEMRRHEGDTFSPSLNERENGISKRFGGNETPSLQRVECL